MQSEVHDLVRLAWTWFAQHRMGHGQGEHPEGVGGLDHRHPQPVRVRFDEVGQHGVEPFDLTGLLGAELLGLQGLLQARSQRVEEREDPP